MRTLLLNASYEPLCIIPVTRAVVLVMADKADVVSDSEAVLRSPSVSIAAPSVIRLRTYVKVPYRKSLPLTKRNVLARDSHRCSYCTSKGDTVDHVIPRSRGGLNVWTNVVAACRRCNNRKDDRLLSEIGWKLKFEPKAPTGWSWVAVGFATVDPMWEPWVGARSAPAVA